MKKLFSIIILSLVGLFSAVAQDNFTPTMGYGPGYTIYLKNGKTIKGKLVKVDGDDVKIYLDSMGLWRVYKMSRVEKIELEPGWGSGTDAQTWVYSDTVPVGRGRGYVNAGYVHWLSNDIGRLNSFQVNLSYGYQFNPNVFLGVNLGLDCSAAEELTVFMPIGLHARFDLLRNLTSPYIEFRGGYSIDTTGWGGIGLFFHPSVGLRVFPCDRWPINVSLGYMMQNYKGTGHTANAITISVGTAF